MSSDSPGDGATEMTANRDFDLGLRLGIASQLGDSTYEDRDYYEAFDWPSTDSEELNAEYFYAKYLRSGYAQTVNDKPAATTWRVNPRVVDGGDAFKDQVDTLAENTNLWQFAARADRVAGIGEHGLLLLGFEDVVGDLDAWETDATEASLSGLDAVTQYKPVGQWQITDVDWGGPGSERWGLPVEYEIDLDDTAATSGADQQTITVHWTRAIDIPAQRPLDDETLARPRIEPVLNNIIDIEKAKGATAESAYRGADYGLHLNIDPTEVDPNSVDTGELRDELRRYEAGLQKYLRTVGTEVNRLGGEVADPSGIIESNLDEISAVTGIPKKELRGNESGEVTGAEADKESYFGVIAERQEQYATPHIVTAIVDRLRAVGVLDDPDGGSYTVEWPDLSTTSEEDEAKIQANRASVVQVARTALPGVPAEEWLEYLDTGEIPEDAAAAAADTANVDESDPNVTETFDRMAGVAEADD